jgi:transcriptional regulator with XRE-family HTH domain
VIDRAVSDGPTHRAERNEESVVSYTEEVGERLRRVRVDKGLSLQDVERRSDGRWKAAVVGSYERGDRNISATRLLELAEFYGVSPSAVLPGDPSASGASSGYGIVLDLERLESLGARYAALRRYLETIQVQRGDFNRRVLSIRNEDLRALAVVHDTTAAELLDELRRLGVSTDHAAPEA